MSLVNPNDIIIRNTVGLITASVKEANRHLDKFREHNTFEEGKYRTIAEYIREMPQIHFIIQNRANGVPLDNLVEPSRIANDRTRLGNENNTNERGQANTERAYESWFRQ